MPPLPVQCPRCAYDLSGQVAAWTAQCALAGRCSECGLDFEWREILDPDFAGPGWSFEHGHRRRISRYFATLARVIHPARAWRELQLSTSLRPARLAAFAFLTLVLSHLAIALVILASRAATPQLARLIPRQAPRILLWPYGEGRAQSLLDGMPFGVPSLLITAGLTLSMPAGLLLLGETLHRHSVRPRHLLRGAAYSLPLAGLWLILTTAFRNILWHSPGYTIIEGMMHHWASMPMLGLIYASLLGLWWRSFLSRYLRLASPGLIAGVMMSLAYLATFTFLLVITIITRSI
ncbi:MAG: hypothetical protein IT436_08275 [Phycisphaerales bacterium]|nr:hypothetical protein [Phycisphaerales bacterium]